MPVDILENLVASQILNRASNGLDPFEIFFSADFVFLDPDYQKMIIDTLIEYLLSFDESLGVLGRFGIIHDKIIELGNSLPELRSSLEKLESIVNVATEFDALVSRAIS